MGKGGGGKGRGKGGCENACEAAGQTLCCAICILFIGPIFIAIGIGMFVAAGKDSRNKAIDRVNTAATTWKGTGINSYQALERLRLVADVDYCASGSRMSNTIDLNVRSDPIDVYRDEGNRYTGVPQRRLSATLPPSSCGYDVSVRKQGDPPGSSITSYTISSNTKTVLYDVTAAGPYHCTSTNRDTSRGCRDNCEVYFGGRWSGSPYYECQRSLYYNDLCLKISQNAAGAWISDATYPKPDHGCSAWGYEMYRERPFEFQVPNATLRNPPGVITLTVRASSDPWLKYQAETGGIGDFGLTQGQLVRGGITILIIGIALTSCWVMIGYQAYRIFTRRMPEQRPAGFFGGRAWDVAYRYGYVTGYPVAYAGGEYQMGPVYGGPPPTGAYAYPPPGPPGAYPPGAYPPPPGAYPGYPPQPGYPPAPAPGMPAYGYPMGPPPPGSPGVGGPWPAAPAPGAAAPYGQEHASSSQGPQQQLLGPGPSSSTPPPYPSISKF